MGENLDDLLDVLDTEEEASRKFRRALSQLESMANDGSSEAAEAIAETFAFSEVHRNPEKAYLWYHVAFATQGFGTSFENRHETIEQYCGTDGDFSNEAQVNELLAKLGEARIRELDAIAAEWLRRHRAV
jgi:hypothetical protein